MKTYEYKVIGPSAPETHNKLLPLQGDLANKQWSLIGVFNHIGKQGWKFCGKYSENNFLFMKEYDIPLRGRG